MTTAPDKGDLGCLMANYNRSCGDWANFEREDDIDKDLKVFEAELATSAAPIYLPPFVKESTDHINGRCGPTADGVEKWSLGTSGAEAVGPLWLAAWNIDTLVCFGSVKECEELVPLSLGEEFVAE